MVAMLSSGMFDLLLKELRALEVPERVDEWPTEHIRLFSEAGGWKWNIPEVDGGLGLPPEEMLQVYRRLASASLLTTFILTQRNAACQRIESSANRPLRDQLLSGLCSGKLFATVGISHLTTSRQHLQTPAVTVSRTADGSGYRLKGTIPWATAATEAGILVTGGTLTDGRQILAAVPTDRTGVDVTSPVTLMGLSASRTGAVELHDVCITDEEILHGPVEKVMSKVSGGGAGSLGTSALALGAAEGTLAQLQNEISQRPELDEFVSPLHHEAEELSDLLRAAAEGSIEDPVMTAEILRRRANLLAIRSAQVWLAATKGAGYVAGHPAERAVRESMFFLVWSCPQPVLYANLRELACQ